VDTHTQARAEWFVEQIPRLVNADADLLRRAKWFDCRWVLKVGAQEFHLSQRHGHMAAVQRGPLFMAQWSFALEASAEDWIALWQPVPPPGRHDILALSKNGLLLDQRRYHTADAQSPGREGRGRKAAGVDGGCRRSGGP
jgi:hypothetical protein